MNGLDIEAHRLHKTTGFHQLVLGQSMCYWPEAGVVGSYWLFKVGCLNGGWNTQLTPLGWPFVRLKTTITNLHLTWMTIYPPPLAVSWISKTSNLLIHHSVKLKDSFIVCGNVPDTGRDLLWSSIPHIYRSLFARKKTSSSSFRRCVNVWVRLAERWDPSVTKNLQAYER